MKKKILSLALSFVMAFSFMSANVVNASAAKSYSSKVSVARVWDGTVDTDWFTKDPRKTEYNIYTAEELAGLMEILNEEIHDNGMSGVTINLMNDIVLNDTSDFEKWDKNPPKNKWIPGGKDRGFILGRNPFAGIFNGNGHTISGMYCVEDSQKTMYGLPVDERVGTAGLFRCFSGAGVINLRMEKCYSKAADDAGVIVSYSEGSIFEMVEIDNCKVIAGNAAGGIIGSAHNWTNSAAWKFVSYFTGAAVTGLLLNPLLLIDGMSEANANTFIVNCKTKDSIITRNAETHLTNYTGGFIGNTAVPAGFRGNLLVNTKLGGNAGAISGGVAVAKENYIVQKSYQYGVTDINGKKIKTHDVGTVKNIKKSSLTGASLPKTLGKYFVQDKGNEPRIKTINDTPVDVVLNKTNATISWEKVANATKYKVYYKKSNGKYSELTTTTKTSTTLKNIKKGKTLEIMIRAYFKDGTYKTVDGGKFKFKA